MSRKKVLITGGARGIGEALTRAFALSGYAVYIHCGKSVAEAEELCAELPEAYFLSADLALPESVAAVARFCPDPDVLINNAGVSLTGLFDKITPAAAREMYEINRFAPVMLTRAQLPAMLSRSGGCIINISSVFGESGGSCEVDYSAAKAGIIGFTKALAKEVGPAGVRVNCICPGVIDTDMNASLSFDDVASLSDDIPLMRLGSAEEVAGAAVFLASQAASYLTGAVIDINGGWMG